MTISAADSVFDLTVKENPARRLRNLIDSAGYDGPAEFIIKVLDVFESAMGANGKVVVKNERDDKRYVFDVRYQ